VAVALYRGMYVCLCVRMYACMHACMYVGTHTHTHTRCKNLNNEITVWYMLYDLGETNLGLLNFVWWCLIFSA